MFKDEVENAIGVRPDGWVLSDEPDGGAAMWFAWTPSEDKPEGQPLSWEQLETLNERFDIASVESNSSGRTGSRLRVEVRNP